MDATLSERYARLGKFLALTNSATAGQTAARHATIEAVMLIERLAALMPAAQETVRDCLPRLAEAAGTPQN